MQLGSAKLDFDSLVKRAASIKKWGNALTEAGDILFYGCDLAATQEGKSLRRCALAAAFTSLADGTYWTVVDSRTFTLAPAQLASLAAGQNDIWAEQTYGVTGAMNGAASFLGAAGALFGGRNAEVSDNSIVPRRPHSPEHVTRVVVAGASEAAVDSAFSFKPS